MGKKFYSITVTKLIAATPSQIWETWKDPDIYKIIHEIHKADIDFDDKSWDAVLVQGPITFPLIQRIRRKLGYLV